MFKWKATLQAPTFDFSKFRRDLREELTDQIIQAAFAWLDAVLELIPVWSGASRATFLHLTREIGFPLVINPTGPNRINYGLRNSSGEFNLAQADQGRVSFTYETDLKHLIYNEFNNANVVPDDTLFFRLLQPGPYGFQEKGAAAASRILAQTTIPDWRRYLKVTTKRVGR